MQSLTIKKSAFTSLIALAGALVVACGGGSGAELVGDTDPEETDPTQTEKDPVGTTEENTGGAPAVLEEPVQPELIASNVQDGDSGVLPTVAIKLEFNVPMNSVSFEQNYSSEGLSPDKVTFSWNDSWTAVTITPDQKLAYSYGEDIDTLEPAIEYSFTLSGKAESADGETLGEDYNVTFSTARKLASYISAAGSLNGHVRSDGTFQAGGTAVYVGDSGVQDLLGDAQYVGVLAFPLVDLEPTAFAVDYAVITVSQEVNTGAPAELAETSTVYDIQIGERTWASVSAELTPENKMGLLLSNELGGRILEVTDAVAGDLGSQDLTVFGLALAKARDNDGAPDTYEYTNATLSVGYWLE